MVDVSNCFSQSSHQVFEHLTEADGLSSDKVTAMIQDRDGFYWIGTQNGLNRFDGTSFTTYYHQPGDSASLAHNFCTAILEDTLGDIWITTYGGLSRYDKKSRSFETIPLSSSKTFSPNSLRLTNLITDGKDRIWITGNGLWEYNIHSGKMTLHAPSKQGQYEKQKPSYYEFIRHMVYDVEKNGLWVSLAEDFNFYDLQSGQFYSRQNNPKGWKVFDVTEPGPVALDAKGNLWFINEVSNTLTRFDFRLNDLVEEQKGILRTIMNILSDASDRIWLLYWSDRTEVYDPVKGQRTSDFLEHYHDHSVLSTFVTGLYVDKEKNTWILSEKGISVFRPQNQFYKIYPFDLSGFTTQSAIISVYGVAQITDDCLWLGTDVGLIRLELLTGRLEKIKLSLSETKAGKFQLPYQRERVTCVWSDGPYLYFGLENRVFRMDVNRGVILAEYAVPGDVQFIRCDQNHHIWVGTWSSGLYKIIPESEHIIHYQKSETLEVGLKNNALLTGMIDSNTLWIGYNGGKGFAQMDITSSRFTHHVPVIDNSTSYAAGTINAIARTFDHYWLGTYGSGLIRYHPATDTYENFQQGQGLRSNYVNVILPDNQNRLWISTADGLSVYDPSTSALQPLSIDLSFPNNDYVESGCRGINGNFYFFQYDKIVEINPAAYRPDLSFPRVVISKFSIFERESTLPANGMAIRLNYRQNFFSLKFSVVKSNPHRKTHYAYKLDGFDPDWIETSTSPYAGYTNVPPGEYRFMIRVKNEAGQWSDAVWTRELVITPPFWKTGWFVVLSIFGIMSLLYSLHRYRINQVKRIYSIRTQISRDLHDDIGASLSSIHIYSTVAASEMEENPQKAKSFLQQINTNSRQVMEDISDIVWANRLQHKEHTPIGARIKNYGYDLLSQKNIRCTYNIDPEIENRLTRPEARRNVLLIIKEALNNIAKYSQASDAEIILAVRGHEMYLSVKDNGVGFDPITTGRGNGLDHMRKRAESMDGKIELHSQPGQGTRVTCHIPITKISDRFI